MKRVESHWPTVLVSVTDQEWIFSGNGLGKEEVLTSVRLDTVRIWREIGKYYTAHIKDSSRNITYPYSWCLECSELANERLKYTIYNHKFAFFFFVHDGVHFPWAPAKPVTRGLNVNIIICLKPLNLEEWPASNFFLQYHPWITH